jgi:hypothetical protein
MSSIGYHQFEVEYEKKKYSGDPDRVTKKETYKVPKEFRDQTVGYHSSIMKRIQGHPESAATHNKHKADGFSVSEKPIKFKTVHEEIKIDEMKMKTVLSYASKAGDSQDKLDTTTDAGHRKFWNRQKGQALALDKTNPVWKRLKAKVGTTKEDVDTARAASAKAKDLEDKGHDAERMGDEKKMRRIFADMVQQKLKSKEAMKNEEVLDEGEFKKNDLERAQAALERTKEANKTKNIKQEPDINKRAQNFIRQGFLQKQLSYMKGRIAQNAPRTEEVELEEAVEAKPKSMIPQAKQDLQKTKDLFKKVQAVGKEMKNPGYNVDDRVNHFRIQKHMHDILIKKRSDIASKAIKKEEVELVEAGQDKNYHEFWADRTRRKIGMLKQKGKAVPAVLLSKLKKHQQALTQIKSGRATQVAAESADVRTLNTASRDIKTSTRIAPDGRVELVKRKMPRTEIEVGKKSAALESINKTNMMQDSINKMVKMDPLAPKTKIVLPPSQGLKSVGGDTQTHANMAEEKLNRLYESLSEKNKVKFMEKLDTEEGFDQLIRFAEEQGF